MRAGAQMLLEVQSYTKFFKETIFFADFFSFSEKLNISPKIQNVTFLPILSTF